MKKISFTNFTLNNINRAFVFLEDLTGDTKRDGVIEIRCSLYTCHKFRQFGKTAFDECLTSKLPYGRIFCADIIEDELVFDDKLIMTSKYGNVQIEVDFSFPIMIINNIKEKNDTVRKI